jgi:phosphatidylglycerophosphatase A
MNLKRSPPPPLAFLWRHPAHLIACGFGSGLSPWASGSVGTLFAWATYPLLEILFPLEATRAVFLLLAFVLGVSACQIAGRNLGAADHGAIVWDEIVPFWMILLMTPDALPWELTAFLLFRFYDTVKPAPARWFDTQMKNGLGVMMDDLVAAGYTIFTLALLKALLEAPF